MERLDGFVAAKRAIRGRYDSAFAGIRGIRSFPNHANEGSACWFSGIVVEDPKLCFYYRNRLTWLDRAPAERARSTLGESR